MIPSKRVLGYKPSIYTKATWAGSEISFFGGIVLALLGHTAWGWALIISGIALAGIFLYCASVDHKRWCPIHGTEKEDAEIPEVQDKPESEDSM